MYIRRNEHQYFILLREKEKTALRANEKTEHLIIFSQLIDEN